MIYKTHLEQISIKKYYFQVQMQILGLHLKQLFQKIKQRKNLIKNLSWKDLIINYGAQD